MKDTEELIAHVREENGCYEIQTVTEHATGTAALSESFAAVFGAAEWGRVSGLWHDVGKCTTTEFRRSLNLPWKPDVVLTKDCA